ncbi:hypothetical protein DYE50_05295 [Treponema ruminis]|uniref:3'-phosphate/5'-hydroxy nucleic acid ligase n=1 Tax=Treponema ruminis TaxID=744515 RepID=A0A7W8GAQ3_9SPIR|nr:RtcB family protein [Treponema ruminis]MBB5226791.1 hypothetical protein [Treponema ruminis]QSI01987.1 hypothetical protein DYE50_05295 [Treponema ruminis]
MLEVKGKYNTAKVFTDNLEESGRAQIERLCDQPYAADSKIRMMPDVHADAGRVMGRKEARYKLKMEDFEDSMKGVWSSTVCKDTIDEAPMAYKDMSEIVANIEPSAEIENIIKPIFNFKAAE